MCTIFLRDLHDSRITIAVLISVRQLGGRTDLLVVYLKLGEVSWHDLGLSLALTKGTAMTESTSDHLVLTTSYEDMHWAS